MKQYLMQLLIAMFSVQLVVPYLNGLNQDVQDDVRKHLTDDEVKAENVVDASLVGLPDVHHDVLLDVVNVVLLRLSKMIRWMLCTVCVYFLVLMLEISAHELCDVELDVLLLSDEVVDDQLVLPDVDVDDIALDVLFELPDRVVQYLSADVYVDVHDHLVIVEVDDLVQDLC